MLIEKKLQEWLFHKKKIEQQRLNTIMEIEQQDVKMRKLGYIDNKQFCAELLLCYVKTNLRIY